MRSRVASTHLHCDAGLGGAAEFGRVLQPLVRLLPCALLLPGLLLPCCRADGWPAAADGAALRHGERAARPKHAAGSCTDPARAGGGGRRCSRPCSGELGICKRRRDSYKRHGVGPCRTDSLRRDMVVGEPLLWRATPIGTLLDCQSDVRSQQREGAKCVEFALHSPSATATAPHHACSVRPPSLSPTCVTDCWQRQELQQKGVPP